MKSISREIMILSLLLYYTGAVVSPPAYGGYAVVLKDFELDQVHAAGLNLGFDGFLGNADAITNQATGAAIRVNASGNEPVVLTTNAGLAVRLPTAPKSPAAPQAPAAPASPVAPESVTAPGTTEVALNTSVGPVSEVTAPVAPSAPAAPTAPVAPTPPSPVVTGTYTSTNGRFGAVAFESVGAPQNAGTNVLNVSETAQQYLSALNNVNAAGSTVLIQQNLVVLINSNVQNLNNMNNLNLSNLVPVP